MMKKAAVWLTGCRMGGAADTETDEELFRRFLGGDEGALASLIERCGDSMTVYICARIGDMQEAEDLMLDAFSRVCARKPRFGDGGFRPYLYRTARNLALRYSAKNRLCRHFGFDDMAFEPEGGEPPEHTAQAREQNRLLRLCMDRLNPDYREALYLVYFESLTHDEAAAVMGKGRRQVDNLVCRGKKALRALLESEGITDAQYI